MARRIFIILGLGGLICWAAIAAPTVSEESIPMIEELKLFSKTIGAVHEAYVGDTEPRQLFYGAVQGILSSLGDKYAQFFDPKMYELLQMHMKGEYAGIGVILEIVNHYPEVKQVRPDGAGAKAGIQILDRILDIDGVSMKDQSLPDVAARLRGEAASDVKLKIERPSLRKTIELVVRREKIEMESVVDARILAPGVGYFRIASFQEHTTEQVERTLEQLRQKGLQAVIIDLRDNDGGLLTQAVELAGLFLPEGTKVVSVKSKIKEQQKDHATTRNKSPAKERLAVLVNGQSASASEIFSACLQDHKRAVIVGVQTFGKASVQSVVPLDEKSAMKFTTARYMSPLGRMIDGVGLKPDEWIERKPGDSMDPQIIRALTLLIETRNKNTIPQQKTKGKP